ncbi:hypothetical protein BX600DRAFT_383973 [Xylariales sp. PMI_506]|nr:hypothetical protein BX600DRAFT_383973 [Xylariales sp. PMI_506]
MAASAAGSGVPSHQRCIPGSYNIPIAKWPTSIPDPSVDASTIATEVLEQLNQACEQKNPKAIREIFADDGYWRDYLCISMGLRSIKGNVAIADFVSKSDHHQPRLELDQSSPLRQAQVANFDPLGNVKGIQSFVTVASKHGIGRGVMRIVSVGGEWKIWTMFTALEELDGFKETIGPNRPQGVDHNPDPERKNWTERRADEVDFVGREPEVIVIGAGQAGLSLLARLKMVQVPALGIDQEDDIGDNWRRRYRHLVLHDPVWFDHMPYIKFPEFWPIFTPKDKLADFLKSYAEMVELDIWTRTRLKSCTRDDDRWTVVLERTKLDGSIELRTFHPKCLVQATGNSGKKYVPDVPGMEGFKGDLLCHSSEFKGAKAGGNEKKAVVIGSCNSAFDVCQDYYENGYDVTMVQRSSITLMSVKAGYVMLGSLYNEGAPPLEDADLLMWSMPGELFKAFQVELTKIIDAMDADITSGLGRAGFKTDSGPDGCGHFVRFFQSGGGYYIDTGGTQLIIEGKVKVKHGSGLQEITPHGVKLEDGSELQADEIVLATGYQNMKTTTEEIFGTEIASQVKNVWGYNEEGEMNVLWGKSGVPGLWLHGGNLAMCRFFSRLVALQIKAHIEGKDY